MMVIKGKKKPTANVTFLPRTLTLLNSRTPGPWHWTEACPASGLRLHAVSGLPVSGDKCPSSGKKLMPLVTCLYIFHLGQYVQENGFLLFSCLELPHCYTLMLQYRNYCYKIKIKLT